MVVSKWLDKLPNKKPISAQALTRILTWFLVIMLGWILGRLIWATVQPSSAVPSWQPQAQQGAASQSAGPKVSDILAMNLFGRYQQDAPVVKQEPVKQDAPQTRLNLRLVGLVASNQSKTSLAVIAHQGRQNTYGISEAIDGTRATLQAVYADRVIIRNSGRDETLMLDGVKYGKAQQSAPTRSAPKAQPQKNEAVSSAQLSKIKQEILDKPQNLFSYIRLSQVKKDGDLVGYRVNPGKERVLFDAVGLKANDLAVSLNGNDLTDPTVMAKLWTELSQATSFSLTVEREGQLHDIYIELQ
ncbi:type II secretion system protein GspC [Photobacterium jeanii]|uniref:Type II secretion system protein GspC n=1 Tax=Photobacterium jeanii TaxID=858640 RepID=A0A178KPA1_9GAMM|nr:type II secretion system protein GspC [Photobacterium jeanii]OAN19209.1 type II secretion system protein GspC [Photobacterium jeanii]PST87217.1 type II secretion system protein GspC [Photobacterium jeanii]